MFSLLSYIGATLWAEPEKNPFTGPNAEFLFELHKKSIELRLLDRAEAGHMDIESRKQLALLLLDWHQKIEKEMPTEKQKQTESSQDIELHRKIRLRTIEKRLYELCEAERDWFFALDKNIRQQVVLLLNSTDSSKTTDSSLLYYKKALAQD